MTDKTSIDIKWDRGGRISYSVSGLILPPPRDNKKLYVLAPSALFLLAHQFGSMKPSHGLITCGMVIDMLYDKKYVVLPINSALKSATIDILYYEDSSLKVQVFPKQGLFANSDGVEEGVRQLINNYTHYAYTQVDKYGQLLLTSLISIAISEYFTFIEGELKTHSIGRDKDVWSISFSMTAGRLIAWLSQHYYIPPHGTSSEIEEFERAHLELQNELRPQLESQRGSLFAEMGLN